MIIKLFKQYSIVLLIFLIIAIGGCRKDVKSPVAFEGYSKDGASSTVLPPFSKNQKIDISTQNTQSNQINRQTDSLLIAKKLSHLDGLPRAANLMAKPNDYFLKNDKIWVVVQGLGRDIALNPYGGNIIDASFIGENDYFNEMGLLINGAFTFEPKEAKVITDGSDGKEARIRFNGEVTSFDYIDVGMVLKISQSNMNVPIELDDKNIPNLSVEIDYVLKPEWKHVEIETRLTNNADTEIPLLLGHVFDVGRDIYSFAPMGCGFANGANNMPFSAMNDTLIFAGKEPVSYGVRYHGSKDNFLINAASVLFSIYKLENPISLLSFKTNPPLKIAPKDTLTMTSDFILGTGDVSSVLEKSLALSEEKTFSLNGKITLKESTQPISNAIIAVDKLSEKNNKYLPYSNTTSNNESFHFSLPTGNYRVYAYKKGYPYITTNNEPDYHAVEVTDNNPADLALQLGETGKVVFSIQSSDGNFLPGKVVVVGNDPSLPTQTIENIDFEPVPYGISTVEFTGNGKKEFNLEPGKYKLFAYRGLEYAPYSKEIEVKASETSTFSAVIEKVIDTEGYISGDFHIHTGISSDGKISIENKAIAISAEGLEIAAITDHDYLNNIEQEITNLGYSEYFKPLIGEEMTTSNRGHMNIYPYLKTAEEKTNNGAVDWSGPGRVSKTYDEVFENYPAENERVIQLNHPRGNSREKAIWNEYFSVMDLDFQDSKPTVGEKAWSNDAMRLPENAPRKIFTHFTASEVYSWFDLVFKDSLNFFNHGKIHTMLGGSDSHKSKYAEIVGFPRNYIYFGTDNISDISPEDVARRINKGNVSISGGIFTKLRLGENGNISNDVCEGELITLNSGQVELDITIETIFAYKEVKLSIIDSGEYAKDSKGTKYDNDHTVELAEVSSSGGFKKYTFNDKITVDVNKDSYFIILVQGGSLFPYIPYHKGTVEDTQITDLFNGEPTQEAPKARAITNPIFVDYDGDGEFKPSFKKASSEIPDEIKSGHFVANKR
ncbi:MAG: CehA/McbA family metallohydrolase [Pseudomonadota bacterium]